jgi:hypothetical protein
MLLSTRLTHRDERANGLVDAALKLWAARSKTLGWYGSDGSERR